jgi:hypothetical protein
LQLPSFFESPLPSRFRTKNGGLPYHGCSKPCSQTSSNATCKLWWSERWSSEPTSYLASHVFPQMGVSENGLHLPIYDMYIYICDMYILYQFEVGKCTQQKKTEKLSAMGFSRKFR